MTEFDELLPSDPLLSLLDSYVVTGNNIESRVMEQIAQEEEQNTLRAEMTALRAEVAAMRAEMAELRHLLLSRRDAIPTPTATITTDNTRGKPLLPYARREETPLVFG